MLFTKQLLFSRFRPFAITVSKPNARTPLYLPGFFTGFFSPSLSLATRRLGATAR